MEKKVLAGIFILIMIFQTAGFYAISADSNSYSFGNYHLGSSGNDGSSSTYSLKSTTTYEQGTSKNITSTSYEGFLRWFKNIIEEETTTQPSTSTGDTSGGGGGGSGGGGVAAPAVSDISVNPSEINLNMILNTNLEQKISITNTGSNDETVAINSEGLENMVLIEQESISISPGETEEITVVFVARNETGIFTGKIKIGGKEVLVALNVRSERLLFDSIIEILNRNSEVQKGDDLDAQITLIPMGDEARYDVTLNYEIKDYEYNTYYTKSESILIDSQKTIERQFETSSLPVGDYVVGLEVVYPNGVAPASAHFKIVEKVPFFSLKNINMYITAILLLVVMIAIGILIRNIIKKPIRLRK